MDAEPRAVLVVGVQAAGKSTIGRLLAERCERGAFIEGDQLWKMVVSGRSDMAPGAREEAERQLELRYRHGALLAESFVAAGFVAVHVDNMYGARVTAHLAELSCPRSLVVLRPSVEVVVARELARGTSAYAGWLDDGRTLREAVEQFDRWLGEIPSIGLWLDTSMQSPGETVDEIVRRWPEAFVD